MVIIVRGAGVVRHNQPACDANVRPRAEGQKKHTLQAICDMPTSPINRMKMSVWATRVSRIINKSPGSDKGFSDEDIARDAKADFSKMSTWAIICEEMLDTQYPRIYFERAREELRRRGITDNEITEMRRFAWLTAGWLNFEKMVWDWCNLDEQDIYLAIEWQYSDGWISAKEKARRIEYVKKYGNAA
jgi:hypothetical protein